MSIVHFTSWRAQPFIIKMSKHAGKLEELHISHCVSAECLLRLSFTLLCFIPVSSLPASQPAPLLLPCLPSKVPMLGPHSPNHFIGISPTIFVSGSFLFEARSAPSEMHASHMHCPVSFDKSGHVLPNHHFPTLSRCIL